MREVWYYGDTYDRQTQKVKRYIKVHLSEKPGETICGTKYFEERFGKHRIKTRWRDSIKITCFMQNYFKNIEETNCKKCELQKKRTE